MGLAAINPTLYGKLLSKTLPKVIESDEEVDRLVELLEELDFKKDSTAEEKALAELIAKLIEAHDDEHYPIDPSPPHLMVQFPMEQRGLRQADLVPVIGSRAQVSALVNGKRGISKAQAKELAEFFHTSADLFI